MGCVDLVGTTVGAELGACVGHKVGGTPAPISLASFAWWDWRAGTTKDAPEDPEINAWMDRIGEYAPAQATGASQPDLEADHIYFDGDDRLDLSTTAFNFTSFGRPESLDFCVYELVRWDNTTSFQQSLFSVDQGANLVRSKIGSANSWVAQHTSVQTAGSTVSSGVWYWTYYGVQGSMLRARRRGDIERSAALSVADENELNAIYIGSRATGQYFTGRTKGIVVFKGFWPTAAQHAQMQAWADVELGYA